MVTTSHSNTLSEPMPYALESIEWPPPRLYPPAMPTVGHVPPTIVCPVLFAKAMASYPSMPAPSLAAGPW